MARGINKVILVGNLGTDPETRFTASGAAVTNLRIATSEVWRDKQTGEQNERTEWHRVVMFNKLAEVAGEFLRKGAQVYIEGKLQTRKWQDPSGQDRYSTEIVANEFQMLGGRTGGGGPSGPGGYDDNYENRGNRGQYGGGQGQGQSPGGYGGGGNQGGYGGGQGGGNQYGGGYGGGNQYGGGGKPYGGGQRGGYGGGGGAGTSAPASGGYGNGNTGNVGNSNGNQNTAPGNYQSDDEDYPATVPNDDFTDDDIPF